MKMNKFGLAAVAVVLSTAGAYAAPFGPATANLTSFDVPTVTLGAGSGTIEINGGTAQLKSGTGTLAGTYSGSGAGTLNFSFTPGLTVANPITSLFSFSDNVGGSYVFNLSSIETLSFSNSPGVSTSIGVYLLGNFGDSNLNLNPTPTSLMISFNQTGTADYTEMGSLSNPPTPPVIQPVPEPASMALLGFGLAGLAVVRRRTKT